MEGARSQVVNERNKAYLMQELNLMIIVFFFLHILNKKDCEVEKKFAFSYKILNSKTQDSHCRNSRRNSAPKITTRLRRLYCRSSRFVCSAAHQSTTGYHSEECYIYKYIQKNSNLTQMNVQSLPVGVLFCKLGTFSWFSDAFVKDVLPALPYSCELSKHCLGNAAVLIRASSGTMLKCDSMCHTWLNDFWELRLWYVVTLSEPLYMLIKVE